MAAFSCSRYCPLSCSNSCLLSVNALPLSMATRARTTVSDWPYSESSSSRPMVLTSSRARGNLEAGRQAMGRRSGDQVADHGLHRPGCSLVLGMHNTQARP